MFKKAKSAPLVRPVLPIGGLADITTGGFYEGIDGEMILFGGQNYIDNIAGPGNLFKTEQIIYRALSLLNRYKSYKVVIYDTENTLTYRRMQQRALRFPNLVGFDFAEQARMFEEDPEDPNIRFLLIQSADMPGEEFFSMLQEERDSRRKRIKHFTRTTPHHNGKEFMSTMMTMFIAIDTLSAFTPSMIEKGFLEGQDLGDSGQNMIAMTGGRVKSILIGQLPNLTVRGGMSISMSAHMGELKVMDKHAPAPLKLSFTKNGLKHKNVPENFKNFSNNLFEGVHSTPLYNSSSDKTPRFPLNEASTKGTNSDLIQVTFISTRGKLGASGITYPYVISQREGILVELSQYNYLYDHAKGYGITSSPNKQQHNLHLYPELTLTRTTTRDKCDTDRLLARALAYTCELFQMSMFYPDIDVPTPEEIYKGVIAQGYDWNVILRTQEWWEFLEDLTKDSIPHLSTLSLIHLSQGTYKPKWYDKFAKRLALEDVKESKSK